MASDPYLLERMRRILAEHSVVWTEKSMFGGDSFMVDDKMLIGTFKGGIMARINPDEAEILIQRDGAAPMMHGGRRMKGYIYLTDEAYDRDEDLSFWMEECLEFNPLAKLSKKKE